MMSPAAEAQVNQNFPHLEKCVRTALRSQFVLFYSQVEQHTMPFGRKAREPEPGGGGETPWSKKAAGGLASAEDVAFAAELRAYAYEPELHQAVRGAAAWRHMSREREWWRRTSLCERVGHCAQAPLTFLPMPGDVRVCVHSPVHCEHEGTRFILLEWGDWMEQEISFIRRCVTADCFAVDIGANHGVFALSMAKTVRRGHVWAFEPACKTADLLETSKSANELETLSVVRAAVSDVAGTAEFIIEEMGSEFNHLSSTSYQAEAERSGTATEKVGTNAEEMIA